MSVSKPTGDPAGTSKNEAPLRAGWRDRPAPSRFDPGRADYDDSLVAHRHAIEDDSIGYMDPATGLFVMTALYLHDRGWCCDRGCRHCPYVDAVAVDDSSESEQSDE